MSSQVSLTLIGPDSASVALWEWLRAETGLRGLVSRNSAPGVPGEMGAMTELVVTLASSGTAAVLARSLQVWLMQRRSGVKVTLTSANGAKQEIHVWDGKLADPDKIIRAVMETLEKEPERSSQPSAQPTDSSSPA